MKLRGEQVALYLSQVVTEQETPVSLALRTQLNRDRALLRWEASIGKHRSTRRSRAAHEPASARMNAHYPALRETVWSRAPYTTTRCLHTLRRTVIHSLGVGIVLASFCLLGIRFHRFTPLGKNASRA